ncbi:MAG: PAS domain S-box protein [Bacteroidales bacterium]|nr:PAS domain S-box protein [Bacteroidales bacterium]
MFVDFFQNATLLVTLTMLYGLVARLRKGKPKLFVVFSGLLFGGVAVAAMNMPFEMEPGIIYDGRSVILTLAGLFGGIIPSVIAVAVASFFRLYVGGIGVYAGVSTIVLCALTGLSFRQIYLRKVHKFNLLGFYFIGFVSHLVMLGAQLTLPWPGAWHILGNIWQPVLVLFPPVFMLIAYFIHGEEVKIVAAAKIAQAESLFRATFYSIGDAVIITDANGIVQKLNLSAEKLTGYTENEAIGTSCEKVVRLEDEVSGKLLPNPVANVLEQGRIIGLSNGVLAVSRQDEKYPVTYSASPIVDESSKQKGMVIILRDQSADRQQQKQLTDSELMLREAQRIAKLGHFTLNIVHGFWSCSKELDNIFGIDSHYKKDFDGWLSIVHPDFKQEVEGVFQSLVNGGREQHNMVFKITDHKEGKEKWVQGLCKAKHDEKNVVVEIFGTIQDITSLKDAENIIGRQAQIVDQVHDSIFAADTQGLITDWNKGAQKLHGFNEEEVIGKHVSFLVPDEHKQMFNEHIAKRMSTEGEYYLEVPMIKKDGGTFHANVSLSVFYGASKKVSGIIGYAIDFTRQKLLEGELKQTNEKYLALNEELNESLVHIQLINAELKEAKEKAEQSDRMKSAFLANMSHEIRTPMNGILGFTSLLRNDNISPAAKNTYIDIVERSSKRLLATINDLIDISRIESGQVSVFETRINVHELLHELDLLFRTETEAKGLKYRVVNQLVADQNETFTDKEKIYSILTNFIKNAIKFTSAGEIEVGCLYKQGNIVFYVKDTGVGIAKENHKLIFERFVQEDTNLSRKFEGSGLGLAISKAYTHLLGGEIWVESEKGQGACFYLSLPFKTDNQLHSPDSSITEADDAKTVVPLHLLVVEDDYFSFKYFEELLSEYCAELLHAPSGLEAIDIFSENPQINLVLMDVKLPGLDGYETTRRIKKIRPEIPVIAQTAFALDEDKQKAYDAGCVDFVAKPINATELLIKIRKHLAAGNI